MSWAAAVGDRLNLDESMMVDTPWRNRGKLRKLLTAADVNVKGITFGNKGVLVMAVCFVRVERYHGAKARSVLMQNGYTVR